MENITVTTLGTSDSGGGGGGQETTSLLNSILNSLVTTTAVPSTTTQSTNVPTSSTLSTLLHEDTTKSNAVPLQYTTVLDAADNSQGITTGVIPSTTTTAPGGVSDSLNMTILISACAAAGTVLLAIIIVIVCICCRCGRKKDKQHQYHAEEGTTSRPPPGKRPDPVGGQDSLPKEVHRKESNQSNEPVFKVDDPADGYKYKPYIVGADHKDDTNTQNVYTNTGLHGELSIPRPSVIHKTSDVSESSSNRKYHPAQLYTGASIQRNNTSQPKSDAYKEHGYNTKIAEEPVMLREEPKIDRPNERRYVQHSQKKDTTPSVSPDRAKSGKYETTIVPYGGSTYNISGDFTLSVQPPPVVNQEIRQNTGNQVIRQTSDPQKQNESPTNINAPNVLPKPVVTQTKAKPTRKVPPENEPKKTTETNELANNPVFNKRKDIIAKECKTIRLKDETAAYDDVKTTDMFVKANNNTTEEEDPYYKIRESKINLNMNIIPQGYRNQRVESTVTVYDDVVPPTQPNDDQSEEEYEDTIVVNPVQGNNGGQGDDQMYENGIVGDHGGTEYVNIPTLNNNNREHIYGNEGNGDYVNVPTELTDTARRRLPSMRASMPPDKLSDAVAQLFDDAIAGSEIDLSIAPSPPTSPANNQKAPVLKRKTKMEERKSVDEPAGRDSWRISRSSFFDEIGADRPAPQLQGGQYPKEDNINAAMVKKGMALRDHNKPFNYIT